MTDEKKYRRLVLDPRCLRPYYEIGNDKIYVDATSAIEQALQHPYITDSERAILEETKNQVRINRFDHS